VGKDLTTFSLETVEMFRKDAVAAGFSIGSGLNQGSGLKAQGSRLRAHEP